MTTTADVSTSRPGPLRVGLVVARFPLASELFVYELAHSLIEAGPKVDLIAVEGVEPGGILDGTPFARLAAHLRAPEAGPADAPWAWSSPRAMALRILRAAEWPAIARQARLFRTAGAYDIVHAQFGPLGLLCLRHMALGNLQARGLVVHLRGSDITAFVGQRGPRVYDPLFARADAVIANSIFFRDRAVALGCPADKITVIGSPIDTAFFAPPPVPRDPPTDRPLRLVAVGRLVEKKGFADAIGAVAGLAAAGTDAALDILGEGPLRAALQAQVAEAGLADRVRLRGVATRDQVRAALHRADVALAPSVTASTGDADAPVNTLKEAMATGLPVVATRHGGIPELVIPGENGALVPERDPEALAAAIADLARDPADWARLGQAGREKVVAEYGRDAILARTLATYDAALGGRRRS